MKDWSEARRVVLSLGSNLGERLENLQGGVDALFDAWGLRLVALSPVYETEPIGGPKQDPFLNVIVVADTVLTPETLLERAQNVEDAFHRVREVRWGPRALDVDIISLGTETRSDPDLTLPHPRAHERAFVLRPWADIDPTAEIVGHGAVRDLLRSVAAQELQRRDDLTLQVPQ
ncbi:2-amino-4-hydroxy-6-hydroxymethyldihydropteridine diphosphokinase [Salinactinospora qingdaonensis]|uniref:2-amino-4-hydroxy-6-hydroxymethyldihydropteridine diphosphokinase n=1 Tax=Salinactinospora qingdaonensis TaxID=702744 RepID=A0ABP7G4R9_9ACTN